jgi:two-component system response regulator NreC
VAVVTTYPIEADAPASDRSVTTGTIRIVVADDHRIVRRGVCLILDSEPGLEVVGEAGNVVTALRAVRAHAPDVLLLDLHMPGDSSLTAIPAIREVAPATAIVVLTMHDEPAYAREAMRAGAGAYVLKEAADDELVEAVRLAARGKTYLTPNLGARLAVLPDRPASPGRLSPRETEVLRLVALGYTGTEMAEELGINLRTVESHRARIYRKLELDTRAQLVAYARQHDIA